MTSSGLDLLTPGGGIADMRELGVVEAYKLKKAVVSSASEAAEVNSHPGQIPTTIERLIY
jgi:T-complex protein 1 subunit beta